MRRSTAPRSCARGRCAAPSTSSRRGISRGCSRSPASDRAARRRPCTGREAIDGPELARAESIVARGPARRRPRCRAESCSPHSRPAASSTSGQRGYHLLFALSAARDRVLGARRRRRGQGPTREQYIVLAEDWIPASRRAGRAARGVLRPLRRVARAGRARAISRGGRGFRSGCPAGPRRRHPIGSSSWATTPEPQYVRPRPRRARTRRPPRVLALPPFEEYYLSYADRTVPCAPEFLKAVGPSMNGIVRPILVADGEIVGRLDPLRRGRPARGRAAPRALRPGRRVGGRCRGGARPLPRLHHRVACAGGRTPGPSPRRAGRGTRRPRCRRRRGTRRGGAARTCACARARSARPCRSTSS